MVKWGLLGLALIVAVVRFLVYEASQPVFKKGDEVRIVTVIEDTNYFRLGNITIGVPEQPITSYGDKVRIEGSVVKGVNNNLSLKTSSWEIIQPGKGIRREMDKIRQVSGEHWQQWLPANEAALAQGILLGGTEMFSSETKTNFRRVGISHIVAASGFNVMLVAGWVSLWGLRLFGRRYSIPFVIACITLYMLLAGWNPPVVRAGIMATITAIGIGLGRKTDGVWLLALTGVAMMIYRPEWVTSVSWQLSMGSMVAMVGIANGLKWLRWPLSDLFITLAVNVVTLPIILFWFGTISIVAPLANVAVLWIVPVLMQITAIATVLGMISFELGQFAAWIAWPGLKWVTWVTQLLADWPGASQEVGKINLIWVVAYYLLGYILIYLWKKRSKENT